MAMMTNSKGPEMISMNVAEAKARLSEILGRVAHGGETVLITRRGKPMAKLVPPQAAEVPHLAEVKGWLEDDDLFFTTMDSIVEERSEHLPGAVRGKDPFAS